MRFHHVPVSAAVVAISAWACFFQGTVKPDDMATTQHEAEARREKDAAERERARYDPDAVAIRGGGRELMETSINPTVRHREAAERMERHARQHAAAAQELSRFEDEQCAGIGLTQRDSCPFLPGFVAASEEIPGGVRLVMLEGVNPDPLVKILRCHAAFSRAMHAGPVEDCAPYVSGVTVEKSQDGKGIELMAKPDLVPELRRRAGGQVAVREVP